MILNPPTEGTTALYVDEQEPSKEMKRLATPIDIEIGNVDIAGRVARQDDETLSFEMRIKSQRDDLGRESVRTTSSKRYNHVIHSQAVNAIRNLILLRQLITTGT